jgi:tetratricopeptide (TPR) repeat protein
LGRAIAEAGDDGRLAALRETLRQRSEATAAAAARERVLALGTAAYLAFENRNYVQAAGDAREALKLAPQDKRYRLLLMNALSRNGQYEEALAVADEVIATDAKDAVSLAQRGVIRQRLGLQALAREDYDAALAASHLPVATEIGLLADLGRPAQARARYLQAQASGELAAMPGVDAAYLAVRVGEDAAASAAFAGADAAGKLPDTAYQDAAFADVRLGLDAQAIAYFKRSIDDEGALKLRMEPQMLFATRRAVAEVSRTSGAIASLTYRGAVSGLGLGPGGGGGGDSLQAGVETWWRPWGYNNGRYAEVFARAFDTLYSKEGGATGAQSLQAAVGIRYKPLSETNLVGSLSRVFSRSGGRNDWLAQIGYSGGTGGDLRVDAPAWWTTRVSAEAGRYLTGRQTYALAQLQAGRSMVLGDEARRWVLFPHLSVAADYDSSAVETSSVGAGPGISLRYWFREDVYNAPRSYLDLTLQYRLRVSGAQRARGVFLNSTLSY